MKGGGWLLAIALTLGIIADQMGEVRTSLLKSGIDLERLVLTEEGLVVR